MKKIYMILAAIALLSMSLNAQNGAKVIEKAPKFTATNQSQGKTYIGKNDQAPTMNQLLRGIKGMSSVLQASNDPNGTSGKGISRAPLKINSGEELVGPYTTNDFSTNGYGFPDAYGDNGQQIYIFTDLPRADFADHDGEEIVGFRFAVAGNSSQTAEFYNFMAWPYGPNGWFETANQHTWSIPQYGGAAPVNTFDDIVITVPGNSVVFTEITVYDQSNNVITQWTSSDPVSQVTSGGQTYTYYDRPSGWSLENVYMFRWSNGGNYYGYLSTTSQSSITIDGSYLDGCTSASVVVKAMGDYGTETLSINGTSWTVTTSIAPYTKSLAPSGSGAPSYMGLAGGQWHEFYLDEPVVFHVSDTISGLYMGYSYYQYPSAVTGHLLYPIAVNPNSTSHNHYSIRYGVSSATTTYDNIVITPTGTLTNFRSIVVKSNGTTVTSWTTSNGRTLPTGWTCSSSWSYSSNYGGYTNGSITIDNSLFNSGSNITLEISAYGDNANQTITVNNFSPRSITTSVPSSPYTWNIDPTVTYSYANGWWDDEFNGDLAVQLIFKSSTHPELAISPADQTIDDNAAGSLTVTGTDIDGNISVSAGTGWSLTPTSLSSTGGNVSVTYTGRDLVTSTTVTASATGATDATATVNYVADVYIVGDFGTGWDFTNGTHMTYNNGTYTATITANANSYILFARLLGNSNPWGTRDVFGPDSNGNWWMQGNSAGGNLNLNDDNCIYFPDAGTYTITIDATNGTFTITKVPDNQTATPEITYTDNGDSVTITATGDGTVTLTAGGQTVSGEGSASITIPYGPAATTVTATATAQEDGKAESAPATAQVPIPGGATDWLEMKGDYTNPNTLLSFEDLDGEAIMLVDQFWASTMHNDHKDGYTYTLREEEKTSSPVDIPVYKTSSTMQGLYTLSEIESDTDMHLKAQALNSAMSYEVNPDHNTLYHSLYRSDVNSDENVIVYPEIDVQHRVSQLQKYEEMVNGTVNYYFTEMHTSGVTPRYDHVGNEIVTPLDTNYVTGVYGDEISYVPVIWTFGLYTAREDGKNNSYGSDIKRETLGKVDVSIEGSHSGGNNAENTGNGWEGLYEYNGVTYCIYTPIITITGTTPETRTQNDGDVSEYEPYMFRAWCLYDGARKFANNAQGILIDDGERPAPFLLGEQTVTADVDHVTIGSAWQQGQGPLQWAFAVPENTQGGDIQFAVRFYYKKKVTEAGTAPEGNGAKFNRDGEDDAEYYIVENTGNGSEIGTFINEFLAGKTIVGQTYVNAQGMKSSKPFEGLNIVITRYSDGTMSTTKVIR